MSSHEHVTTYICLQNRLARMVQKCFASAFDTILGHRAAWRPILSCASHTLVSTRYRSLNRWCSVLVHVIKLRSSTGERYKLLPTPGRNPLSCHMEYNSRSTEAEWGERGAAPHAPEHRRSLDQAGAKLRVLRVTMKNGNVSGLTSNSISHMFYFTEI
jgi:hypothetical protein